MARTGRVYVIRDPDGNMVYVGSSEDPYRLTRHRNQCKSDGLACPLYRHANEHHDGMSGYTEETVATINLPGDREQAKTMLRSLESLVLRGIRRAHPDITLLNKNSPRSENVRNRERMKAWREANGQGHVCPVSTPIVCPDWLTVTPGIRPLCLVSGACDHVSHLTGWVATAGRGGPRETHLESRPRSLRPTLVSKPRGLYYNSKRGASTTIVHAIA